MKNVQKIIDIIGGLAALESRGAIRIENQGYMPLSIDFLGIGPRGLPMIAVAHNFVQNGDLMSRSRHADSRSTPTADITPSTARNRPWAPTTRQSSSGTTARSISARRSSAT